MYLLLIFVFLSTFLKKLENNGEDTYCQTKDKPSEKVGGIMPTEGKPCIPQHKGE